MRKPYATRAVASCVLQAPGQSIAVKLYKKAEANTGFGIDGHFYHRKDQSRVSRVAVCDECNEQLAPEDMMHAYEIGGELLELDKALLDQAWQTDEYMRIISCPSFSSLATSIFDGTIMLNEVYELTATEQFGEQALNKLLAACKREHQCLYVSFSLQHQVRKALVLPNGLCYTLYYEDEIRAARPSYNTQLKVKLTDIMDLGIKIKAKLKGVGKQQPKVSVDSVLARLVIKPDQEKVSVK